MSSQGGSAVVRLIYDEINRAMWAIAIVFSLYFLLLVLPKLPEARDRAEVLRILQSNAENEHYCQKLHMGTEASMHDDCIQVLLQLRNDIENRIADDGDF